MENATRGVKWQPNIAFWAVFIGQLIGVELWTVRPDARTRSVCHRLPSLITRDAKPTSRHILSGAGAPSRCRSRWNILLGVGAGVGISWANCREVIKFVINQNLDYL